jgi:anti-anti-sigma factor
MLKRFTDRLKKAWAETAPVNSGAPRHNPFAEIVGPLNFRNAAALRANLWRLLWRPSRVIALDCSQVRFMDGCALAVLVEFAQACKEEGVALRLSNPSAEMWNAFSMYGLSEVLVSLAELHELDSGVLIVLEEDFEDSIRLPAVAVPYGDPLGPALVVHDEEYPDSIRIAATRDAA